jgi:hypothetical protein
VEDLSEQFRRAVQLASDHGWTKNDSVSVLSEVASQLPNSSIDWNEEYHWVTIADDKSAATVSPKAMVLMTAPLVLIQNEYQYLLNRVTRKSQIAICAFPDWEAYTLSIDRKLLEDHFNIDLTGENIDYMCISPEMLWWATV